MRLSTIISLGASTVLGVGALIVARVMLPAHHEAPVAPAVVEGVPVVTAAVAIPYGTRLQAKDLTITKLPAAAVPAGAYSSPDAILNQPGGAPIAVAAMAPREPVLPGKLGGPGERFTLAAVIADGMRAYTVGVTEISGVGGHAMPGDRVDVVLTRDLTPSSGGPSARKLVSSVVVQNVRVLGMGLNANPTSTQPAVSASATLEVSVQDAEKLALAAQAGGLSLALRRTGADDVAPVHPVLVNDLAAGAGSTSDRPGLKGEHPIPVRHRARGPSTSGGMSERPRSAVIIVNGEARSSMSVPSDPLGAGA